MPTDSRALRRMRPAVPRFTCSKLRMACGLWLGASAACMAGEANVTNATVDCDLSRQCTFYVTVLHVDTGWEHYADYWRILSPEGDELGRRVLLHPHQSEQPFTRSLSGINVPAGINQVVIQAHDSVHEYGGSELIVDIP